MSATSAKRQVRADVQRAVRRPVAVPVAANNATDKLLHINSRAHLKEIIAREHQGSRCYSITPALAGWLLELNTGNRKISRLRVERYQHIIQTGLWMNTGEPIIVSSDGVLNEGQHRLLAIKATGVAVPCDIRFGITRDAFHATGTGATRSAGDIVSISTHVSYATNIASAARLLRQYQMGLPGSARVIMPPQEIVAAAEQWMEGLTFAARSVFKLSGKHSVRINNSASMAFVFLACKHKNEATVMEFMEIVASGLASDANNPARRLYDRFRREAETGIGSIPRAVSIERLALYIKAWLAWLANEKLASNSLRYRVAGPQSEAFPEIPGIKL